jgi:hypothetical protein
MMYENFIPRLSRIFFRVKLSLELRKESVKSTLNTSVQSPSSSPHPFGRYFENIHIVHLELDKYKD